MEFLLHSRPTAPFVKKWLSNQPSLDKLNRWKSPYNVGLSRDMTAHSRNRNKSFIENDYATQSKP